MNIKAKKIFAREFLIFIGFCALVGASFPAGAGYD